MPSFTQARAIVRGMLEAGRPFEHIENFIDCYRSLDDEERALLWLYAWLGAEPTVVARELGSQLERVGA